MQHKIDGLYIIRTYIRISISRVAALQKKGVKCNIKLIKYAIYGRTDRWTYIRINSSRVAALQKKGVKCNIKMMHYFALAAWHGQTVQQTCSQK